MRSQFLAAAALLCSWGLAHAQQGSGAPPIGPIAQVGYDDELRTRSINTGSGAIMIEVMPSAEAAIREIHRERGRRYAAMGGSADAMARSDANMRARSQESSLFFRMNDKGELLGLIQTTTLEFQPFKIMMLGFNDGKVARVVFYGANDRDGRVLAFTAFDAAGNLLSFARLAAFETRVTMID